MNPYKVVEDFEKHMANFVNSPYAIALDSCTNALFLCCYYLKVKQVSIPNKTYISVPCSIIHAGGNVLFENIDWEGNYQLKPYPIYDYACQLERNMYVKNTFQCISFSANKALNIGKGGMIFTDNEKAVKWFKKARYEGREEIPLMDQEIFDFVGWNMYMTPEQASRGLVLANYLKDKQILKQEYPDLSKRFKPQ
jgi:dTDP-4-amino-4,6-dideoxygalactose transaminase